MAGPFGPASFWTQANALVRKNLTLQKRNIGTNVLLICYPAFFFILIPLLKLFYDGSVEKEMLKQCDPKTNPSCSNLDFVDPLLFTWLVLLLFPDALKSLVYEKQQKLMMKMHGLGNLPYLIISYCHFLLICSFRMLILVIFGSLIGLKFLVFNKFGVQFVFYFTCINLQLTMGFVGAAFISSVKTATVIANIYVFGTGLLGRFIFQSLVESNSFPKMWVMIMELYPGFSLHRGIYEFALYAQLKGGMLWEDLNDSENGMIEVLIIMFVEWLVVLFVVYSLDGDVSLGSKESTLHDQMDSADVNQEREKVNQLLRESITSHAIVCDNLQKTHPGRDGNPEKVVVQGLYLVVARGECFGMLGPNGAGKTSFINMMIGLTKPTSGTAYVQGLDIRTHMDEICSSMGVCPQQDLLWETLTGREHLLFYGRLKNLKGSALTQAVEESLKSLNLFHGGVADKQAREYNGGMKRMLSVAISLIGDPKVVYMEEPSTGLDPTSRNNLWNVVKNAKQDRAIILTTQIMEEAEFLCDRLGIFVDGSLLCIGNPKELKDRYGGSYMLTITISSDRKKQITSVDHEKEVENMVQHFLPSANKVYQLNSTQTFEIPKSEVRIVDVFELVKAARIKFTVSDWGLNEINMEDVFNRASQRKSVSRHREWESKAINEPTERRKIVSICQEKGKAIIEPTDVKKRATPAGEVIIRETDESSIIDKGKAAQDFQMIIAGALNPTGSVGDVKKRATPAGEVIIRETDESTIIDKGKAAQDFQMIVAGASNPTGSEGGLSYNLDMSSTVKTVADFEAFMARFESENHKAKVTPRFWNLDGELVDFCGFNVPKDCVFFLTKLRERHDFMENFRVALCNGNFMLRQLGAVITDMNYSQIDYLTETRLLEWRIVVKDLMKWGLDLAFLLDYLREVAWRMFAFRAKVEIKNLEHKIADLKKLIELLDN